MPVSPTATTPTAAPPKTASDASFASFAENFDSFLLLLTTQLKNQDPLTPLSATEFTTQLVQFAGVEQNIRQSQSLEQIVALQKSWQTTSAVGYIGKSIEAGGNSALLQNGAAQLNYTLAGTATAATINIKDSAGNVVRTLSGDTAQGAHSLLWDGKSNDSRSLPDGVYTFSVDAKNGNLAVPVTTALSGVVSGVDTAGEQILLLVGNARVPLSDVRAIRATPPT